MRARTAIAVFLPCILLLACTALRGGYSVPTKHPEEVKGRPMCSECHERSGAKNYSRFDHTTFFADQHREQAKQWDKLCWMCHTQNDCTRCHTVGATQFQRNSPHAGDYLSRHRIDGRVDPTPCFRCHGNPRSSKLCARCHGR